MKYLLAHDLGTSGNKVTLFSTEGELLDSEVYAYDTQWFNGVWAEQDAEIWYQAVCQTTKRILSRVNPQDVIGVSFSGQMMGCLCVDEHGKPLRQAIIWADMRSTKEEYRIKELFEEEEFYRITGHRPRASYSLAKLMWIKNNEPEVYEKTYKVLHAKDYVISRLTGEFVTDYSDASSTNLLDINTLEWSKIIADAVEIDMDKMPRIHGSTDVVGSISETASRDTGLVSGTPVVCGGGDGSMSALGAGCIAEGDVFCTLGTSAWNATTANRPIYDAQLRTFNWVHVVPGKYVPCGTMQAAGASLSWFVKQLAKMESQEAKLTGTNVYDILNDMISHVEAGSGGVYFMPYLLGERSPRWNVNARAGFIGIKMDTTKEEMVRSVFEGIAFNLKIILDIVTNRQYTREVMMTGGGAKSAIWCQMFADIYNTDILVPNYIEEATSIGAAVTAGVGIGIYDSFEKIHDFIKIVKRFKPRKKQVALYNSRLEVFEALYRALEPVYDMMART